MEKDPSDEVKEEGFVTELSRRVGAEGQPHHRSPHLRVRKKGSRRDIKAFGYLTIVIDQQGQVSLVFGMGRGGQPLGYLLLKHEGHIGDHRSPANQILQNGGGQVEGEIPDDPHLSLG